MITIEKLRYRYTRNELPWIIDGIDLTVEPGEYILVCGASGSGKSTLCRTFNGLIPHFYAGYLKGKVQVAGLDVRDHPVSELFAHVGMVFQTPETQLFNSSVERELVFGLESLGLSPKEIQRRAAEAIDVVGISELLLRHPHQLSGGEQQLVLIAALLAIDPQMIVLDEPYANLDPFNVERVRTALRAINRRGTTIILTEHHLLGPLNDAGRLIILHKGRILLDGPPRTVLAEDVEPFGLNLPIVVEAARSLRLSPLPLGIDELVSALGDGTIPRHLLPQPKKRAAPGGLPVIQLKNVSFSFDTVQALHDIDLEVYKGECISIVGANGAGKTTLIKHLNGLYRPKRGTVLVMGHDTRRTKVSSLASNVGVAFQNPNDQFFALNVKSEIEVAAHALGRHDPTWLEELLKLFCLHQLCNRSPYHLSGGEKKRVAFASALAARPDILILDEPTAGQDAHFRSQLGGLLDRLRSWGQTILIITHDLEFAQQHSDRWILLAEGRVLKEGDPWEIMADSEAMHRARLKPTQGFELVRKLTKPGTRERRK